MHWLCRQHELDIKRKTLERERASWIEYLISLYPIKYDQNSSPWVKDNTEEEEGEEMRFGTVTIRSQSLTVPGYCISSNLSVHRFDSHDGARSSPPAPAPSLWSPWCPGVARAVSPVVSVDIRHRHRLRLSTYHSPTARISRTRQSYAHKFPLDLSIMCFFFFMLPT